MLCIVVFALCLGFTASAAGKSKTIPEKEISELSAAIKAAHSYREDLRRVLDAMKDSLINAPTEHDRCFMALELARKFRPVNTDSSLFYAYRARSIAEGLDVSYRRQASLAIINALSTAGLFTAAIELFDELGAEPLSGQLRLDYWMAGRRLYGYMKDYSSGNPECFVKYDARYRQYDDSLMVHLPADSRMKAFLTYERLVAQKRYDEAQDGLSRMLLELPQDDNLYAMAAYQMAEVCRNLGEERRYAAMLAVSALSDVKGCVTEGLALPTLADWLYDKGELGESFTFINFALEEATAANARMRAVTIARFVPLIDEAYRDKINSSRDELMIYFMLLTLLLIVTGVLVVFLVKQNKKAKASAQKLAETSKRQESYIGNFIGLYSSYADRLTRLTKLVSTKLAAGQGAELKKLVDSGRFTDEDNGDIHKIFDSAFLDICPDFVERVNSLLKPEEAVVVKSPGSLTPELRIYAFVKLGIDESTRIAQILHYSSNTVYAYRNKMRNKALSRETFDLDVKNL